MATLLYRIGSFSFRRAWAVIAAWLLLAALALGAGLGLGGQMQESFAIPGTESQAAIDRLAAVFPETAGASAQLVLQSDDGAPLDASRDEIDAVASDLTDLEQVSQAVSPFSEYAFDAVSKDGRTAVMQVQFDGAVEDITDVTLDEVDAAVEPLQRAGISVDFGGMLYQDVEYGVTVTELIGVIIAGIVLLVTFGSLIAAGIPLLTAIFGLAVSMGAVLAVAAFATISNATPMLALMIGLAVGIDYGLFVLSRHRQQLAQGIAPAESAAMATGTAGSAVVFAGLTVIIALLGLLVVGIPFLSTMGIAAAFAVLLAVVATVTLLPAVFRLAGSRLAPRAGSRTERRALAAASADGPPSKALGARWVRGVLKAPVAAVVLVLAVLGTLAVPAFSLQLALPSGASDPEGTTARQAYDTIANDLGEGRNGPLIVAVDITQTTEVLESLEAISDELRALPGVDAVSAGMPNRSLDTGVIQVIPETGPADPATAQLVHDIRDLAPGIAAEHDTPIAVTGTTAVQIDISQRLNDALLPFGVIVVGLSIVLLMLVFRSVLVPLKAALGFVLSVLASFGVVVAVFQWGWGAELLGITPGPVLSFMPILLMAVLFGLAMDYEVFLVSGMRERYVHGAEPRQAIERGFAGAARVVTAAALIMFAVFVSFVPEGSGVIKVMALGLAAGVFLDAFLVRMTLVPAVMALMGRTAWWLPRRLDRAMPDVDIEGARLLEHREAVAWARDRDGSVLSAAALQPASHDAEACPATVDVEIAAGEALVITGAERSRSPLAQTFAARRVPASGRLQLAGHTVPSDVARARMAVAYADLGTEQAGLTAGSLLEERLRLRHPWRPSLVRRETREWLSRLDTASRSAGLQPISPRAGLDRAQSRLAVAAAVLAEGTPIAVFEFGNDSPQLEVETLARAIESLADPSTVLVFSAPMPLAMTSRRVHHVPLPPTTTPLPSFTTTPSLEEAVR
ncbi:MMPL family transporter [Ruicaihuangia caeni]|uniref:MMPL family transporter n=1 Tax=Ruicaihuangia caeni TaxID=3042517 RepID=UPI00338DC92E